MTRYLIVSNREAADEVSRGVVVGGSESEFSVLDTEWRDDAIEFLAKILCSSETWEAGPEYGERETYAFVNGDKEGVEAESLCKEASRLSAALVTQHWKVEEDKKISAEAAKKVAQRERDLRDLDRLSKKLGLETNAPKGG